MSPPRTACTPYSRHHARVATHAPKRHRSHEQTKTAAQCQCSSSLQTSRGHQDGMSALAAPDDAPGCAIVTSLSCHCVAGGITTRRQSSYGGGACLLPPCSHPLEPKSARAPEQGERRRRSLPAPRLREAYAAAAQPRPAPLLSLLWIAGPLRSVLLGASGRAHGRGGDALLQQWTDGGVCPRRRWRAEPSAAAAAPASHHPHGVTMPRGLASTQPCTWQGAAAGSAAARSHPPCDHRTAARGAAALAARQGGHGRVIGANGMPTLRGGAGMRAQARRHAAPRTPHTDHASHALLRCLDGVLLPCLRSWQKWSSL